MLFQSPAYRSGKVEEGDEIVQVNYQTVVSITFEKISRHYVYISSLCKHVEFYICKW